jgi:hypothetical protein
MNESFEKRDFAFLLEQMAKAARKRGVIGNSQEKEMAPISNRTLVKVVNIFTYVPGNGKEQNSL